MGKTITYINTKADLINFSFTHSLRQNVVRVMFAIPVIFLAWQLILFVEHRQFPFYLKLTIVVGGILIAIIFILGLHLVMSVLINLGRSKDRAVLTTHTVTLTENGITEGTPSGHSIQNWKSIVEVRRTRKFILIYTQMHAAHVIPLSAFDSKEAADEFYNFAFHHWNEKTQ